MKPCVGVRREDGDDDGDEDDEEEEGGRRRMDKKKSNNPNLKGGEKNIFEFFEFRFSLFFPFRRKHRVFLTWTSDSA